MCGGGSSKAAAPKPPVNMGYTYSPADNSNMQRQVSAVAGKQPSAAYGSELAAAPATPTTAATGAN